MRQDKLNLLADDGQQVEQLIRRARDGCRASLEQLIAASRNYLCSIANQEVPADLRPKMAASDLVQDTLIEAHRDFAGFEGCHEPEFLAWLRRILLNNLANAKRRYRETSKRELARELALDGFDSSTGQMVNLPQEDPSPSSVIVAQEQEQRMMDAIARLPHDYQQVILLRHRDHLPFEEIAKCLNRSSVASRKLWSRAVVRLQQELNVGDDSS